MSLDRHGLMGDLWSYAVEAVVVAQRCVAVAGAWRSGQATNSAEEADAVVVMW